MLSGNAALASKTLAVWETYSQSGSLKYDKDVYEQRGNIFVFQSNGLGAAGGLPDDGEGWDVYIRV